MYKIISQTHTSRGAQETTGGESKERKGYIRNEGIQFKARVLFKINPSLYSAEGEDPARAVRYTLPNNRSEEARPCATRHKGLWDL